MFKVRVVHISDAVLYEGSADRVVLPGVLGDFEIADLHAPIVSLLSRGVVTIYTRAPEHQAPGTGEEGRGPGTLVSVPIEQGLVRFDGEELYAVVE